MDNKYVKIYQLNNKFYAAVFIGDIPIKLIYENSLIELTMSMDMYFGEYWGLE